MVEICRRLDGIPLAIELAAARVAVMGPGEIAGHLDERFRLLTGARRGRVERHQTLRAAVEWSYSLLAEKERAVFDRLGVFPASFDEPAAVAVCGDAEIERWDVIDALTSLVGKSLVGLERSGETTRYQLLETLRHYARQRVGGEIDGLRRRHALHYASLAESIGAGLDSPDELRWRPRLAAELDNLRSATGWAFDAPDVGDVALGVHVVDALVFEACTQFSWGIQTWAAAALTRVEELDLAQRAAVLAAASLDAFIVGDTNRAVTLGRQAISASERFTPALFTALSMVSACCSSAATQSERRRSSPRPDGSFPVMARRTGRHGGCTYSSAGSPMSLETVTQPGPRHNRPWPSPGALQCRHGWRTPWPSGANHCATRTPTKLRGHRGEHPTRRIRGRRQHVRPFAHERRRAPMRLGRHAGRHPGDPQRNRARRPKRESDLLGERRRDWSDWAARASRRHSSGRYAQRRRHRPRSPDRYMPLLQRHQPGTSEPLTRRRGPRPGRLP